MSNNEKKQPKKPRNIKRVINYRITPDFMCTPVPGKTYLTVTYIMDRGNLIQDIQKQTSEIICVKDDMLQAKKTRYAQSKQKIQHDLEMQIYATGANRFNAEITAKKLFEQYVR